MLDLTKYSRLFAASVLIAGLLFNLFGLSGYTTSFFVTFLLAAGFSIGTHETLAQREWLSLLMVSVLFFGLLLVGSPEGILLVAKMVPLVLAFMWLGKWIQAKRKKEASKNLKVTD